MSTNGENPENWVLRNDLGNHVTELVLNRPEKLNALVLPDMPRRIFALIDECCDDDDVRVIIIKGAGRAFCAGDDWSGAHGRASVGAPPPEDMDSAFAGVTVADDILRMQRTGLPNWIAIFNAPKPVLAQIHGYCMGAATILASVCDIVVVAEDTRIGTLAVPTGAACFGPMWSFHMGMRRAKQQTFQTTTMTGTQAAEWGWANYAVPADELEQNVRQLARNIAKSPPDNVRLEKEAINYVWANMGFREILRLQTAWHAAAHQSRGSIEARELNGKLGLRAASNMYAAESETTAPRARKAEIKR